MGISLSLCNTFPMNDGYMHRCLELAQMARGHTGINPMVGAVLVRDGKIIAEAFHEEFGGLHAEALLIKKCVQKIRQEDRLYVNLEPCVHIEKKTPPCTEAIIRSGIKHVVIGMLDPNPLVSGKGIEELRNGGIEVIGPVEQARCEWFNRGFVSVLTKQRPWITLKKAQNAKGHIAKPDGSKMKITDARQDAWSHEFLRAKHDAILVGVGTVISDNPLLTCRIDPSTDSTGSPQASSGGKWKMENFQPLRIVLDPDLRIPLSAKIVNGEIGKGTMIVRKGAEDSAESSEKVKELQDRGVHIVRIPMNAGVFDMEALLCVLTTPTVDFYGITSILVEGGKTTWDAFSKGNLVDCEVSLMGRP